MATRISGVPELVRDGETGVLVPPQDARALADAIADVYAYPERAAARARAGRALVLREFNLHENVRQLGALYAASHDATAARRVRTPRDTEHHGVSIEESGPRTQKGSIG